MRVYDVNVEKAFSKGNTKRLTCEHLGDVHLNTPLLMACGPPYRCVRLHGPEVDTVNMLVRAGADVNHANRQGVTPLLAAYCAGNLEIVEMIVREGSKVNAAYKEKNTPLLLACARRGNGR